MTIGIAAHGPGAGRAILKALAAVEAVGRGAIGGFVSLVVITAEGEVRRAEVQRGGSAALFDGQEMPDPFAEARLAGLMSSGPDRPEPLSQFTPADAGVGLVTGHRMPNTVGANGMNLNDEVLALMRAGAAPQQAVDQVVGTNPRVDAGIVALSAGGALGAANTAHVAKRGDAGQALLGPAGEGASVAVMHNAIHPHRPLAALAAEVAMDEMQPGDQPTGWIAFAEGTALRAGERNAVRTDGQGRVTAIEVENSAFLDGQWSLGLGYRTPVSGPDGASVMLYEPYMVVRDGRLGSVDGQESLSIPVRRT